MISKSSIESENPELNIFKNCYKNDAISKISIENNMMILKPSIVKAEGHHKDFF